MHKLSGEMPAAFIRNVNKFCEMTSEMEVSQGQDTSTILSCKDWKCLGIEASSGQFQF